MTASCPCRRARRSGGYSRKLSCVMRVSFDETDSGKEGSGPGSPVYNVAGRIDAGVGALLPALIVNI